MSPPDSPAVAAVRLMLRHAREAHSLAEHRLRSDLETDRIFGLCLTRLMEIVGEAGRRVPEEFRRQHPQPDWRGYVGLRNALTHKFDKIDHDELWTTVQNDLPELIVQLEAILESE